MSPSTTPAQFRQAVANGKLLLGVVHLLPLPGSPRGTASLTEITHRAECDARALLTAGFDGYVIENFGDAPFFPDKVPVHVLTIMTRIAQALPRRNAFVGVNVLRNDANGALAVALAANLDFIRVNVHTGAAVTDQGIIQGRAAETLRMRNTLASNVAVLADVAVKHAAPLGATFDLTSVARDVAYRGLADGLIVTGTATGVETSAEDVDVVTKAVPDRPIFVGSGVHEENVETVLQCANGVIVGTSLKKHGRVEEGVDPVRAQRFVRATGRS